MDRWSYSRNPKTTYSWLLRSRPWSSCVKCSWKKLCPSHWRVPQQTQHHRPWPQRGLKVQDQLPKLIHQARPKKKSINYYSRTSPSQSWSCLTIYQPTKALIIQKTTQIYRRCPSNRQNFSCWLSRFQTQIQTSAEISKSSPVTWVHWTQIKTYLEGNVVNRRNRWENSWSNQ